MIKAIERWQFADIPRFCKVMVLEIASKNKQLSSALERPTLTELRDMFIEDGTNIAEALREATQVVKQASSRIFEPGTREAFKTWKIRNPVSYSIGNLQTEIELVMQNVEALSRRFVGFLESAQRARPSGGESIPFMSIVDFMTNPSSVPDLPRLESILGELIPWGLKTHFFHPSLIVSSVELTSQDKEKPSVPTFNIETDCAVSHARFLDFILRNRSLIIDKLKVRPLLFSEMIKETGFSFEEGEVFTDFLGVYSVPEHLDGDGLHIVIGMTGDSFDMNIEDAHFIGSDPLMFLVKENN